MWVKGKLDENPAYAPLTSSAASSQKKRHLGLIGQRCQVDSLQPWLLPFPSLSRKKRICQGTPIPRGSPAGSSSLPSVLSQAQLVLVRGQLCSGVLEQCFSHLSMPQNDMGNLWKHTFLGPNPRMSNSTGLRVGPFALFFFLTCSQMILMVLVQGSQAENAILVTLPGSFSERLNSPQGQPQGSAQIHCSTNTYRFYQMKAVKGGLLIDSGIPWTTGSFMSRPIKLIGNSRVQAA